MFVVRSAVTRHTAAVMAILCRDAEPLSSHHHRRCRRRHQHHRYHKKTQHRYYYQYRLSRNGKYSTILYRVEIKQVKAYMLRILQLRARMIKYDFPLLSHYSD